MDDRGRAECARETRVNTAGRIVPSRVNVISMFEQASRDQWAGLLGNLLVWTNSDNVIQVGCAFVIGCIDESANEQLADVREVAAQALRTLGYKVSQTPEEDRL